MAIIKIVIAGWMLVTAGWMLVTDVQLERLRRWVSRLEQRVRELEVGEEHDRVEG